ncbi:hypothetical protein C8R44DRAFT_758967 [Mycena epipterygia]|nr:hypothetical protein C8R44DRAFT_758967 [Mycena epipterygia]
MSDNTYTPLQSSILLWALLLIPSNVFHYVALGTAAITLPIYATYYLHPSTHLGRVNSAIIATTEILTWAKSECTRNHFDLAEKEGRLLQAKLAVSKIRSHLLEARGTSWKIYYQKIRAISQSLDKCERQLREIETAILLIIETEEERELIENINKTREIVNRYNIPSGQSSQDFGLDQESSSV